MHFEVNATCNIEPETAELRIWMTLKEVRQRRRLGLLHVKSRTFKCKGERNDQKLHYEQVFGNVFGRRESKCRAVLMKHRRKVKGEQMIILQIDQQLKTKNISDAPIQLFCSQCKDKFLLETHCIHKIHFNLLNILTMNSLNAKHQGKNSNQLAFHLPACTHL